MEAIDVACLFSGGPLNGKVIHTTLGDRWRIPVYPNWIGDPIRIVEYTRTSYVHDGMPIYEFTGYLAQPS